MKIFVQILFLCALVPISLCRTGKKLKVVKEGKSKRNKYYEKQRK